MKKIIEAVGYAPRVCVLELTLACNMRCGHCGSRAGEPRADEMSLAELDRVCHELADLGCRRVTLSGGEPILRKEWPHVAKVLNSRGVLVNMVTNGWGWTAETVTTAKQAGLCNVSFSVDGLEATHDAIRRKGSFERCLNAFELCRAQGLRTASIMTLNKRNVGELDAVHDLLTSLGVRIWQLQLADLMGNQRDHSDWALTPDDVPAIEAKIAELMGRSKMRIAVGDNIGFFGEHEEAMRKEARFGFWVGCMAGCQVVGIEANGNVKGCLSQQAESFVEGNLKQQSLRSIWCKPGGFAYNREFKLDQLQGFCRECQYAEFCRGGCTCSAHFASGSSFDNPFCTYRVAQLAGRGVKESVGPARELKEQGEGEVCEPCVR